MQVRVYLVGGQRLDLDLPEDDCDALLWEVGGKGPVLIDVEGVVHTAIRADHISGIEVVR